ncbi:RCC1 domain-containing protein 1 [Thoreauomyces humboldtii]|nr:RCC1 domain-containing protein 1 [Thoreauomyces humboldtii]
MSSSCSRPSSLTPTPPRVARKTLLAFGSNIFRQCAPPPPPPQPHALGSTRPLLIAPPALLQPPPSSLDRDYIGITATASCSLAWTSQGLVHVWGHVAAWLSVEDEGGSDSVLSYACFNVQGGEDGALRKVAVSGEDSPRRIVVLVGTEVRALRPVVETRSSRKRSRAGDEEEKADRRVRTTDVVFTFSQPCLDVAVSTTHGAAVTTRGRLMVWPLGRPEEVVEMSEAETTADRFVSVSGGRLHLLAVTSAGEVFTWGVNGLHGQLGHGACETVARDVPTCVEALLGLTMVAACGGGWHSAAVSADGDLYTFGSNAHGQLALPPSPDDPSFNPALPNPVDMDFDLEPGAHLLAACGSRHTIVSNGKNVYACGWNKYGQGGGNGREEEVDMFRRVQGLDLDGGTVVKVACGAWHSLLLVETASP